MRFLDLFSGIGGFRMGMQRNGHESVGYIEKDKFARKSYEAIYDVSNEWTARDVREIEPGEIPEVECITAGFPCQSFSTAGQRGGFEDTRGTLFFEIAKLADEKKPKYLFLENVSGLLHHDGGKTFGTILNTLQRIGYDAQWQVLNSENFKTPQYRKRIYIVGNLRGKPRPEIFPIREEEKQATSGLETNTNKVLGNPFKLGNSGMRGRRVKELNESMFSVCATADNGVLIDGRLRKLTPREYWRLQGFPDWAFEKANKVNSDTQLYRQAGNAVTVNVVEAIAGRLTQQ